MTSNTDASDGELQFDRVETGASASPSTSAEAGPPGVVCSMCGSRIDSEYFHVEGAPVCASCKETIALHAAPSRSWRAMVPAGLLGLGAAIAGAIVYYGVIALTNFEIGIVAILIGYMVGWGVRKGASGKGGRRFQVLAVGLTYFSVGLAYAPIAMKGISEGKNAPAVAGDSTEAAQAAPTDNGRAAITLGGGDSAQSTQISGAGAALGIAVVVGLVFALPVLIIFGSMPSGLISALIIGIGMRQAWRMTAAPSVNISGPYKVAPATGGSSDPTS